MRTCTTPWTYPLEPYITRGAHMNPPTPPNADLHHTLDIPLGALYPTGSPYEPYVGAGSVGTGSADLGLIWLSFAGGKSGGGSVGTLWGQRCTQQCSQRVHAAPTPKPDVRHARMHARAAYGSEPIQALRPTPCLLARKPGLPGLQLRPGSGSQARSRGRDEEFE